MIAGRGVSNGWAGVIVNGAVRDSAILRTLDNRYQGAGHQPAQEHPERLRREERARLLRRRHLQPGETVYSDDDGVVVR
ncbi:hypothetical protein GS421_17390 [Rhodococcus hoagii]|nr:hypothetical protein [Prescottella equi]